MLKTYLYVPDSLEEKIRYAAELQRKSKAEIMRQALERGIAALKQQSDASVRVLFKIADLGRKNKVRGPKDSVERFDEYLYGKDWSKDE